MSTEQGHSMTAGMFGGGSSEGLVLVVDDENDVRRVARMALEKAGYTVIEAENGEQAIERICSGENPLLLDVIITVFPKRVSDCLPDRHDRISQS